MPRYANYEQPRSRSQQNRDFWRNPANILAIADAEGQAAERREQNQLEYDHQQQVIDQRQAEWDRDFAMKSIAAEDKATEATHAIGAYADIAQLDPSAHDFRRRAVAAFRQYPKSLADKGVQGLFEKQSGLHEEFWKQTNRMLGLPPEEDARNHYIEREDGGTELDGRTIQDISRKYLTTRSDASAAVAAERSAALEASGLSGNVTTTIDPTERVTTRVVEKSLTDKAAAQLQKDFDNTEERRDKLGSILLKPTAVATKEAQDEARKELEVVDPEYMDLGRKLKGDVWFTKRGGVIEKPAGPAPVIRKLTSPDGKTTVTLVFKDGKWQLQP